MSFIFNLLDSYIFRLGPNVALEIEIITDDRFVKFLYFRLGLETMHQLTSERDYTLRVELTDWEGESRYAEYDGFSVGSDADGYTLHIGEYDGNARDALSSNNGARFSTYDNDRDGHSRYNCVAEYGGGGGWWQNVCYYTSLNGEYRSFLQHTSNHGGIVWYQWKNTKNYSMKEAIMKIRHTSP